MAVTHKLYGPAIKNIFNGNMGALDSTATTIRVALMSSNHTFTQSNETWSQVEANEISSTANDYSTAGGEELTGKSLAYSARVTTFDGSSETSFTSTGSITAYHAVLYQESTAGSTASYLLSSIDFDGEQRSVNGTFKLTYSTSGIFTTTVAS